jgi:hypothetical protein
MNHIARFFACSLLVFIAGCATPEPTGPANPHQGIYKGTETLVGGTTVSAGDYALKIYINDQGRIRIVDVDGVDAYGKVEGNQFRVVRPSPRQIFEGKIIDKTISGVTTANIYTGDGTFLLTLQE